MIKTKIVRQNEAPVKTYTRPQQRPPRPDLRKPDLIEEKDRDHKDRDVDLRKD